MMKITELRLDKEEGILTVYTDADKNFGFNFEIDDIINKEDLISKVEQRITEKTTKEELENQREIKFEGLKTICQKQE